MTDREKIRELAHRHQANMRDSQYLQMIYALEEMAEWKDRQVKRYLQHAIWFAQEKGNQYLAKLFEIIIEDLKL